MHLSHFDILATFLPELQTAKVQFFKDITKNLNVFDHVAIPLLRLGGDVYFSHA